MVFWEAIGENGLDIKNRATRVFISVEIWPVRVANCDAKLDVIPCSADQLLFSFQIPAKLRNTVHIYSIFNKLCSSSLAIALYMEKQQYLCTSNFTMFPLY